jgi:hypothetical protein
LILETIECSVFPFILAVILINNMQRPSDSHVVVSLVVDSDIGGEIERRVHFGLSWEGEKNRCR